MISEWPIKPDAPDPASMPARLLAHSLQRADAWSRRIVDAATDLSLPDAHRLTDRTRASMIAMRDTLTGGIERDMRSFIVPHVADRSELAASLTGASVPIAIPILADAGLPLEAPLVAILLRRAGEAALAATAPHAEEPHAYPVDDPDPAVAAAALALLVAQGRRRDAFGQPLILIDDLPAELAHALVWRIAAALRHYLRVQHDMDVHVADMLLTDAAQAVLGRHDEARGLEALADRLARGLGTRLNGGTIAGWLGRGHLSAVVAGLAAMTQVPQAEVWSLLSDPGAERCATMLRAAGFARDDAALVLMVLLDARAVQEIETFDRLTADEATRALSPLRYPPEYRTAALRIHAALAPGAAAW